MAPEKATTGTVVSPSNLTKMQKFGEHLKNRAKLDKDEMRESAQEMQAGIATRILEAKTVEDVWEADQGGIPGGRDLVDLEQEIRTFTIVQGKRDDIESALTGGTYLLVESVALMDFPSLKLSPGDAFTWNTSAPGIVAKIIKFEGLDALPIKAVIRGKDQGGGKTVLQLRPVPNRTVTA